jgi:DNA excision repair protein ERCC-2
MKCFPYTPRKTQLKIADTVEKALSSRQHVLIDSPTGSGKTVAVLVPCVEYAVRTGKKILYLTKTNTQQQQVYKELKKIREKIEFTAMGIQGRANLCVLFKDFENANSEELAKLCRDRKKSTMKHTGTVKEGNEIYLIDEDNSKILELSEGCPYFANLLSLNEEFEDYFLHNVCDITDVLAFADKHHICPYEFIKAHLRYADIIVAPYAYFFVKPIRKALLTWWNTTIENLVVILDEAHNLQDYCRELESASLSLYTVHAAMHEVEECNNPVLGNFISARDFLISIEHMVEECVKEFVKDDEDSFVPPDYLETYLLSNLKTDSTHLNAVIMDLLQAGEIYSEKKRMEGKLPRSYMRAVSNFLVAWFSIGGTEYTKIVSGGENPEIVAFCLDATIAALPLCSVHAGIHMSGTLSPLDEYRDSLGLDKNRTVFLELPSPFAPENLHIVYETTVTTRYEEIYAFPEIFDLIEHEIVRICNSIQRNIIVFFPSFKILQIFVNRGIENRIDKDVYVEAQGMNSIEMGKIIENFRDCSRPKVMLAVIGGRLSEGIDFPDKQLELIVIVGIPYPKPSARQKALQFYYDMKFRKGWEYAVQAPAARKMRQAIGRLIRNENDRGMAIILDKRAKQFSEYLENLNQTDDVIADIKRFFGD